AAKTARFVAGLDTPTAGQVIAADADGDTILTSQDAAFIARYVVSLPNSGIVGSWKFVPANRTYTTLGGNQSSQDFTAILVGETSGNWFQTGPGGFTNEAPSAWTAADESVDVPQPSNGFLLA